MRALPPALLACVLLSACGGPANARRHDCYLDPCLVVSAVRYITSATITDLGVLPGSSQSWAKDVNDAGQIVGEAEMPNGPVAVRWMTPNYQIQPLVTLGGATSSATSINGSGVIAGWSKTPSGQSDGFVWNNGNVLHLRYATPPYMIEPPVIVNDAGMVMANISRPTQGGGALGYWPAGAALALLPDLGPALYHDAWDMNAAGTVVGTAYITLAQPIDSGYTWTYGQKTTLSCPPAAKNCFPQAISDRGLIAGDVFYNSGNPSSWFKDASGYTDLGNICTCYNAESHASDLDDSSLVVVPRCRTQRGIWAGRTPSTRTNTGMQSSSSDLPPCRMTHSGTRCCGS